MKQKFFPSTLGKSLFMLNGVFRKNKASFADRHFSLLESAGAKIIVAV